MIHVVRNIDTLELYNAEQLKCSCRKKDIDTLEPIQRRATEMFMS